MTGGIKIWSNTYISCLQACTKSSVSYKLVRMLASVAMPKLYQSPYLPAKDDNNCQNFYMQTIHTKNK